MEDRIVGILVSDNATMHAEIERLTKERDLALANADTVYSKLMCEVERLRAEVARKRD